MNEKEAIETYKNFLDDTSKNGGYTIDIDFQHKKEYEAMWEILNFIEKCKNNVNSKNKRLKEYAEELEKKDKIIDLMAEYLASIDFDEHCVEVPGICIDCPKEDDLDGYMQCIKQYFERKVEKGE